MKCQKCQFENPEGSNFCFECGAKLEQTCPACTVLLPIGVKFCNKCGYNLTTSTEIPSEPLSFDEKLEKIQKYLPKGLTEKILSQRNKIEGERKQVTVMFCDMVGFTPLVENIGSEDAYSIMDQIYEILIHKVRDYDGTINEMTGDGIMALFGAPIAIEDAPLRAIRSAYSIHRELTKYNDTLKQEKGTIPFIDMRIGIHTGPVVVGTLGNDLRVEFKAVGDTVNLASRIESLAKPGTTYVSEDTFKLTEGFFRFEALGKKDIKGKDEPVLVYQVIVPRTRRTRFDVSAERGLTPFVGRERELELLLDGFERVKSGRGQVFSIMGEAGVGKSRLLYEFRKGIVNEDKLFLEGKCLSYSKDVLYHPIIDVLMSNFDIQEEDDDLNKREKVKNGLKLFGDEELSSLPYFLELLSIKDSGIDQTSLSPEGRKEYIIDALRRISIKGSEARPLIMAIEDLHWIDKSSEDALKYLVETISGARIYLIFTYRPEYAPIWGAKTYHNQVTLSRLSNRESLAMISNLFNTNNIDPVLQELILDKTEGIPFFIEELIKSLINLQIIEKKENRYQLAKHVQEVAIPSTIQDVIMARVDTLPESAKEVLHAGSAIEREFSYGLIKLVMGQSQEDLLSNLSILKDLELIYERGIFPNSTFVFRHALTQDVVYDSILAKKKKILHKKIGKAIENIYKENIEEHYGILAEHYLKGEEINKGEEYSMLAERKALRTGSLVDAISYIKKRINTLEKLPVNNDIIKRLMHDRTTLGIYYTQLDHYYEAKKTIDPIIDLAQEKGDRRILCRIYYIIGAYNLNVEEKLSEALKYLNDASKIASEVGDRTSLGLASNLLTIYYLHNCEPEKAVYYYTKNLDILIATNRKWVISSSKTLLADVHLTFGNSDLCYKHIIEAINLAEESGDIFSKHMAYTIYGKYFLYNGHFKNAEKYLLIGIDLGERSMHLNYNAMTHELLAQVYYSTGNYDKSKEFFEKAILIRTNNKLPQSATNLLKIRLEITLLMKKESNVDLNILYNYESKNKFKIYESGFRALIGEILMNLDNKYLDKAEDYIKKAIETNSENNTLYHLGKNYVLYAKFFNKKGDRLKAKENFSKAIEIFDGCGADGWVERYKKEMAQM